VLVAVETRKKGAGFIAMQAIEGVSQKSVKQVLPRHFRTGQTVKMDALPALNNVSQQHAHRKKVTPPEEASLWLSLVHIMISNIKVHQRCFS
jgi:hypothetical protein